MGVKIPPGEEVQLRVHSPRWGQIRLLHNGQVILRTQGRALQTKVQNPGAYRVEVYRFGRPWLYSNPIYLVRRELPPLEKRRHAPVQRKPWE